MSQGTNSPSIVSLGIIAKERQTRAQCTFVNTLAKVALMGRPKLLKLSQSAQTASQVTTVPLVPTGSETVLQATSVKQKLKNILTHPVRLAPSGTLPMARVRVIVKTALLATTVSLRFPNQYSAQLEHSEPQQALTQQMQPKEANPVLPARPANTALLLDLRTDSTVVKGITRKRVPSPVTFVKKVTNALAPRRQLVPMSKLQTDAMVIAVKSGLA